MAVDATGIGHFFLQPDYLTRRALMSTYNACNLPRLVTRHSGAAFTNGAVGTSLKIRLPVQLKSGRGHTLTAGEGVELIERYALLKLQSPFNVHIENLARSDLTVHITRQRLMDFYMEIGTELATAIDIAFCDELIENVGMYFGAKDKLISITHFSRAKALLSHVPVPKDGKLFGLVSPIMASIMQTALVGPVNQGSSDGSGGEAAMLEKMGAMALSENFIQNLYKVPIFESVHVPDYSPGTWAGTPLVNGAITFEDDGMTTVLNTDGWTVGDIINPGAILEIASVNQVNTRSKRAFRKMSVSVTRKKANGTGDNDGKYVAPANGQLAFSVSPEINAGNHVYTRTDNTTITSTIHNNVDKAPADNAGITVVGDSGKTYKQAIVAHKRCMRRADVPLTDMSGFAKEDKVFNLEGPETARVGFSMRCIKWLNALNVQGSMRVDTWQAFSVTEAMFAIRIIGTDFIPIVASLQSS